MKIQPEFNIAAILSKMSVADLSDNTAREEMPPFASLFEAAVQHMDDPQIATTIAALNQSGMIMPDLMANNGEDNPEMLMADTKQHSGGIGGIGGIGEIIAQPELRTVQLANGRSVITSPVADTDLQRFVSTTDFFSNAADRQSMFPEPNPVPLSSNQQPSTTAMLSDTLPIRSAAEVISLRDRHYLGTTDKARLSDNPSRAELLSFLNGESALDRAGMKTTPSTVPVNQAQAAVPMTDAIRALSAQAPAASIPSMPSMPMSAPLITPDIKTAMTSAKNGMSPQQSDGEFEQGDKNNITTLRSSMLRDTSAVMSREASIAATLPEISARSAPMPSPGSLSTPAEATALSSGATAPAAGTPTTSTAAPSQPASPVTERWMHIDDLGKQFNAMVKRAFLDNSGNGLSSLRIMLYPENMGSIQAEIIDRNKTITVNLIVQNEEVARLLRDNSQSLRDALGNNSLMELNIQKDKSGNEGQMNQDGADMPGNSQASSNDPANTAEVQEGTTGASSINPNALDTYV